MRKVGAPERKRMSAVMSLLSMPLIGPPNAQDAARGRGAAGGVGANALAAGVLWLVLGANERQHNGRGDDRLAAWTCGLLRLAKLLELKVLPQSEHLAVARIAEPGGKE